MNYRYQAKRRGLVFELTLEDFERNWGRACYWCGYRLHTIGWDRRDNSKGYTRDNAVISCSVCNRLKSDLPENVFIAHVHEIAARHPLRV